MKLPEVVGLFSSHPQAGKTTVANRLVAQYGYVRVPMAETLKRMFREMLRDCGHSEGAIAEMENGNKQYPFCEWTDTTLRHAYQTLGTEWGRMAIDPNIWTSIWKSKVTRLLATGKKVVVDDVRFANEFKAVNEVGGLMWMVIKNTNIPRPTHASESFCPDMNLFDHVICNDGSYENLTLKIDIAINT